jgi:Lar family restriction alleviation protein
VRKEKAYPKIDPLPCPFCGKTDGFVERMTICVYQYLCDCGVKGPSVEKLKYESHEGDPDGDAIKAWNRRKWPRLPRPKKAIAE